MFVDSKALSLFKWKVGLRLLAIYGIFFSINDFKYLELIYSCDSYLNLCKFPTLSGVLSSSLVLYALHCVRILAYILIFFQYRIRLSAVVILIISLYFMILNEMVYSPDLPYVHFLLLCLALASSKKEVFFNDVSFGFTAVVYLSYTFSGFYKFITPYWIDGSFLNVFLRSNHLVRPWVDSIQIFPAVLMILTYVTLYGEFLACLALFNKAVKMVIWFILTGVHLGVLVLAAIPEVSLGMLAIHVFLLDEHTFGALRSLFNKLMSMKQVREL